MAGSVHPVSLPRSRVTRMCKLGACEARAGRVSSCLMADVTELLSAIEAGDPHAAGQLLPLVYDELRRLAAQRLAHESAGQTLEPTALVPRHTCAW